jgi:hypothetical protein
MTVDCHRRQVVVVLTPELGGVKGHVDCECIMTSVILEKIWHRKS